MIDSELRVWLIEANNNPGLSECKSTALGSVLNSMMEHVVQVAVDPLFPPPPISPKLNTKYTTIPQSILEENRFELIFDQERDAVPLADIPELFFMNAEIKQDFDKKIREYEED